MALSSPTNSVQRCQKQHVHAKSHPIHEWMGWPMPCSQNQISPFVSPRLPSRMSREALHPPLPTPGPATALYNPLDVLQVCTSDPSHSSPLQHPSPPAPTSTAAVLHAHLICTNAHNLPSTPAHDCERMQHSTQHGPTLPPCRRAALLPHRRGCGALPILVRRAQTHPRRGPAASGTHAHGGGATATPWAPDTHDRNHHDRPMPPARWLLHACAALGCSERHISRSMRRMHAPAPRCRAYTSAAALGPPPTRAVLPLLCPTCRCRPARVPWLRHLHHMRHR